MVYRSVGNRIAVDLRSLRLPIGDRDAKLILGLLGFVETEFNITSCARALVEKSSYKRGARPAEAPGIVDCSSMVKWIYGQMGIWLPRYSVDQRDAGRPVQKAREGDLLFSCGWRSYYWDNPDDGVGHVGLVTSSGTVIHAANKKLGVVESEWERFTCPKEKFRGIRRYLPSGHDLLVLQMTVRTVETSQELRWMILQRL